MIDDPTFASYLRFLSFAQRPFVPESLTEGAFLVAEVTTPQLKRAPYQRQLATYAADVRAELGIAGGARLPLEGLTQRATALRVAAALRTVLAERGRLRGNTRDYYDPRNSLLDCVLERRLGLPLTLSVIYLDVARRIGAPLVGVNFPAHFLIKWPLPMDEGDDLFIDAFDGGQMLDIADVLETFLRLANSTPTQRQTYQALPPTLGPGWNDAADTRTILARLLGNLKHAYLQRGETALALEVTDRLVLLRPDRPEEVRDRGLLRLAMGEPLLAAADIATYAERAPNAPDLKRLRRRIDAAANIRVKLN